MTRNRKAIVFSAILALLALSGILAVVVIVNRPVTRYDLVSPTAPVTIYTPTAQPVSEQTITYQDLIDLTLALDARLRDASLTPSPTPIPPPTTPAYSSVTCGWQWATQPNPDLSETLQQRLHERLGDAYPIEARAESFGENCLNDDGSVRYFATMETDFRITVWLKEFPDAAAAGDVLSPLAQEMLRVLADYPAGETPGPQPGMIGLEFKILAVHRTTTYWVWAGYDSAMTALDQGLSGSALFEALGGLHQQDEITPT